MQRAVVGSVGWVMLVFATSAGLQAAHPQQQPNSSAASPSASQRALVDKYCVVCHNQRVKAGDLLLDKADISNPPAGADVWEKVIRKVRGGLMPPAGMPRPDKAATDGLLSYLTTSIDRAAAAKPNPGRSLVHRLNRTEYGNAVRDLLALNVDVTALLPPDDAGYGFDNIADLLGVSPVLLERYLSAAWKISSLAIGDPKIDPAVQTYRIPPELSQYKHVEGLPLGTRGGYSVVHNFPLYAEYVLRPGRAWWRRPAHGADDVPCAKKIISTLARRAYRGPVSDAQMETLLSFFQQGKNEGGFEIGVEYVVTRILASPEFLFRFERDPATAKPDVPYRISDLELASRLAFFLWSSIPDEQLLNLANQGKLKDPAVLDQQVRRMMSDPRADALIANFVAQWLYLLNLKDIHPDQNQFLDFDEDLRIAMRRETELFVGSLM